MARNSYVYFENGSQRYSLIRNGSIWINRSGLDDITIRRRNDGGDAHGARMPDGHLYSVVAVMAAETGETLRGYEQLPEGMTREWLIEHELLEPGASMSTFNYDEYLDGFYQAAVDSQGFSVGDQQYRLLMEPRTGALLFYHNDREVYCSPLYEVVGEPGDDDKFITLEYTTDDGDVIDERIPFSLSYQGFEVDLKNYLSALEKAAPDFLERVGEAESIHPK